MMTLMKSKNSAVAGDTPSKCKLSNLISPNIATIGKALPSPNLFQTSSTFLRNMINYKVLTLDWLPITGRASMIMQVTKLKDQNQKIFSKQEDHHLLLLHIVREFQGIKLSTNMY